MIGVRTKQRLLACIIAVLPLLMGDTLDVRAQESSDPIPIADGVTVIAGGLLNPRGFVIGDDDSVIVGLAGTGGTRLGTTSVPDGPLYGGATGTVALIDEGCTTVIGRQLPSTTSSTGRTLGVADVVVLGDQLYALVAGGGRAHGNPTQPNGIYRIASTGGSELVADLSAWIQANPVSHPRPLQNDPEGIPTAIAVVEGAFWVVESNGGQVIRVAIDGTVSRVADLSATRETLTDIIAAPNGGAFVSTFGPPPYARGAGRVVQIGANGTVTDVWTRRTAPIAVAIGGDGSLLVLEYATRTSIAQPYFASGTGRLVRQTGPDRAEVVARRLDRPMAMAVGSDGAIFVALPASSADGTGAIVRIAPTAGSSILIPSSPLPAPQCEENSAT